MRQGALGSFLGVSRRSGRTRPRVVTAPTQSQDFENMKSIVALLLIALFAGAQATSTQLVARSVGGLARPQDITPPKGDWCEACVIFMNTQIQELVQIIANIGIQDGCT